MRGSVAEHLGVGLGMAGQGLKLNRYVQDDKLTTERANHRVGVNSFEGNSISN